MRIFLAVVIMFFITTQEVYAQLSVDKFYSLGTNKTDTPDWIELKNNSEDNIDLINYKIRDTATKDVYVWKYKTILTANSSCVLEVYDRLNKSGDIIYILNNNSEQIFCLYYGDGNNKNDCENKTEDLGTDENKPVSNCISETPTPEPTQVPTKEPRPKDDQPLAETPAPTVVLTQKPAANSALQTGRPTPKPKPKNSPVVLATQNAKQEESAGAIHESPELEIEVNSESNFINKLLITLGIILMIISLAWLGYSIYNEKHAFKK